MDRTTVTDAVYDACVELLRADRATLSESTDFAKDLEADSLDLVRGGDGARGRSSASSIPEDELEGVETIGQAADMVLHASPRPMPEPRRPRSPSPASGRSAPPAPTSAANLDASGPPGPPPDRSGVGRRAATPVRFAAEIADFDPTPLGRAAPRPAHRPRVAARRSPRPRRPSPRPGLGRRRQTRPGPHRRR